MKKLVIVIMLIIIIILSFIIYLSKSDIRYNQKMIDKITNNYSVKNKVKYINKYKNYYILMTDKNVIVLNKKYKEILKENKNNLFVFNKKHDIIYETDKLMYQVKKVMNNKITYLYYDAYTGEKINKIIIGG